MIVVDASVLISFADRDHVFHSRAVDQLRASVPRPLRASTMTLAEILVGPTRAGRLDRARAMIKDLRIEAVPVGTDAPERLARLRAESGLKLPDCCVLLAAQDVRAQAVLTFDDRLARAARDAGHATEPP